MFLTELLLTYLTYAHPIVAIARATIRIEGEREEAGLDATSSSAAAAAPSEGGDEVSLPTTPVAVDVYASRRKALMRAVDKMPPEEITNFSVTLVMLWWIDLIDYLFVSHVFAMRELWILLRIALAVWLQHPQYRGGLQLEKMLIQPFLERYATTIDAFLEEHIRDIQKEGFAQHLLNLYAKTSKSLVEGSDKMKKVE